MTHKILILFGRCLWSVMILTWRLAPYYPDLHPIENWTAFQVKYANFRFHDGTALSDEFFINLSCARVDKSICQNYICIGVFGAFGDNSEDTDYVEDV